MKLINETLRNICLEYFSKGSFTRNISVFTSGSAVSFIMGMLFTPIITRIYYPSDYGHFSFFNTLLAIMVAVSSMGFSEALVLPKKTKGFIDLARIIVAISVCITLPLIIVLWLFSPWFLEYFNVGGLGNWILILPFIVILNSYQQIADSYNIRKKQFGINSRARIFSVTLGKASVSAVGLGFGSSVGGLILGEVIVRSANFLALMGKDSLSIFKRTMGRFKWKALKATAFTYKNYPLYILPSSIFVQISVQIPVFFISRIYDIQLLGHYALAVSLLGIPIQVIGFSMGKIFLQKANEIMTTRTEIELGRNILKLYYGLIAMGALGYSLFFGWGVEIFSLVAGRTWSISGKIASILSVALVFQLIGIVLGPTFRVMGREKLQFNINLIGSLLMIASLSLTTYFNFSFFTFIYMTTALISIRFIVILSAIFIITQIRFLKHLVAGIFIIAITFFISHFLNKMYLML